jgi:protoheme IX farnesyltransferase
VLGILAIGMGSASLNHVQDRILDTKMLRTRNRPFPTGRVNLLQALAIVLFFVITGSLLLYLFTGILTFFLGISALIWYNLIYTYLKRISSIAVIPGAVIGGIPPALGWAAAGGDIFDPFILSVSAMLVIWQVPHFWLLLFMYSDDYDRAGLPNLIHVLSESTLRIITFVTIIFTAISAFVIFYTGNIIFFWTMGAALIATCKLLWDSRNMILFKRSVNYKNIFMSINIYTLVILIFVLFGRFFK